MKAFNYIWFLTAGLLDRTQPDESPIEGYTIEEFSSKVEITPGGSTVVLNGTVEQILSQLRDINPNYGTKFAIPADKLEQSVEEEDTSSHLTKRGDVNAEAIRRIDGSTLKRASST